MIWNSDKEIDERLAAQESVRQLVRALPEDVPSLAWRSALNSKLEAQRGRARSRRRLWWIVSPSFGLAVTAVLCFVLFVPHTAPVIATGHPVPVVASLEDQLVASHSDSVTSQDVVGSGLSAGEIQQNNDDPDAQDAPSS